MFSKEKSISNDGEGAINNTGDNPTFNINQYQSKKLNRSYLFAFCDKFSEVLIDFHSETNNQYATDIHLKMTHNSLDLYKLIFQDCDHYIDDVESILNEIVHRSKIIRDINISYERIKRKNVEASADDICDTIFDYLHTKATTSYETSNYEYIIEDLDFAIQCLMYYTFVKCKILEPIR